MNKHYHDRRARGLCTKCAVPTELDANGKPYAQCTKHRNKGNIHTIAMRERRLQAGECLWCAAPAKRGSTYCKKHLQGFREQNATRYQRQVAAGLCAFSSCKKPPLETEKKAYRYCAEHRQDVNEKVEAWREARKTK